MNIVRTLLFVFSVLTIASCEVDPLIYTPGKPLPVIYAVFDDHESTHYMDLYHGHSDYDNLSYYNFENALGFLATSTQYYKDSMSFDFETKHILFNENRLRKIKLIK